MKTTFAFLLLAVSPLGLASTCFDEAAPHQCSRTEDPVTACAEFLETDPYNLQARFSLCDAHINQGTPLKALIVLDHGLALCGQDRNSCDRLKSAIRALEKDSNQTPGSAELRAQQEDNRKTCVSRKRQPVHQAIVACEEALIAFPQDPDLHGAYGEKLLQGKQPARAVLAFRRALVLRPGDANFLSWHDAAEDARQTLVERCLRHTDLQKCNQAIIPGSKDEARLHLRRSSLYLEQGNRPAALEALLIVQVIDPRDVQTSRQLLQLIPATSRIEDDRLYLPRGRALLETGDVQRAILDLRRASSRSLDRDAARAELRRARALRQTIVQTQCFDARDLSACENLVLAGEPDEADIRAFVTSLRAPAPEPAATAPDRTPPVVADAAPARQSHRRPKSTPEPATAEPALNQARVAASYVNVADSSGRTH